MSATFVDPFSPAKRTFIDEEFSFLDKKIAFCNAGSFGVVPKSVQAEQFKFMQEVETDSDVWMRHKSMRLWLENREALAPFFGTSPSNLAFVANTTSAVNAVLSSIAWKKGDVLIINDWTFKSIKAVCKDLVERNENVELCKVQFPYPVADEQSLIGSFLKAVEEIASSGRNPRLAIIDAISAIPAVRFPFEEITKKLKERGVDVLVDGAHTPGQLGQLNLDALGADYFAGNLEKWFFCPKGTAALYVTPKRQLQIRPPVVSMEGSVLFKGCALNDYLANHFFWQGTMNNTSYACVKKALEFVETVGGFPVIMDYNSRLSAAAENLILRRCPRTELFKIYDNGVAPYLKNYLATPNKPKALDFIQSDMYHRYGVWTSVTRLRHEGERLYDDATVLFRLSAQINNKMADYERLAIGVDHFVKGNDTDYSLH